jgi:thymidylate synthase (FAD)
MKVILVASPRLDNLDSWSGLAKAREDQLVGPPAQQVIEIAGRTCYDSLGKGRDSEAYAEHILDAGHGSVLEHANFTFLISGVSRGLTHELVRHRVGIAVSQRSTRYVDESKTSYALHPAFKRHASKALKAAWRAEETRAKTLYRRTCVEIFNNLMKSGVNKYDARKQAFGAARGILGNALSTELVWTANARALRHVIEMRGSVSADAEIRELAQKLLKIMVVQLPVYFSDFDKYAKGLRSWVEPMYSKV